jgi:hypothetical protein
MPDLPESREMTHRIHDVVRSLALRLIDDQGAVKQSGLWLARHVTFFGDPISAIRVPDSFVVSRY